MLSESDTGALELYQAIYSQDPESAENCPAQSVTIRG